MIPLRTLLALPASSDDPGAFADGPVKRGYCPGSPYGMARHRDGHLRDARSAAIAVGKRTAHDFERHCIEENEAIDKLVKVALRPARDCAISLERCEVSPAGDRFAIGRGDRRLSK
jgi:hypothetical protein